MSTKQNLKYGLVFKPSDGEILVKGSIHERVHKFEKESLKIVQKLIKKGLMPNERRITVSESTGKWFAECDQQSIIHVCLVDFEYNDRLAYQFIKESMQSISKISSYYTLSQRKVEAEFWGTFSDLMEKYNNPEAFDMFSKTNAIATIITDKAKQNLANADINRGQMQDTNQRAQGLLVLAREQNDHADNLHKILYWRNMKLKMIMSMMSFAAVFSLVVPIFQATIIMIKYITDD